MANPNPARITDAMWQLWVRRPSTRWRLGGIYADKPHYHNTVEANLARWPESYSVRFPLDAQHGPDDKARAIDYTMSDAEMKLYTQRLLDACDQQDPRVRGLREFYGTVDGRNVVGRIRNTDHGPFRFSRSDRSHLWHIHLAVWAAYCASWSVLSGIISVLRGESLQQWKDGGTMLPKLNDDTEEVGYWQGVLNAVGARDSSGGALQVDNEYGPKTASALLGFARRVGGESSEYRGEYLTGRLAQKLHQTWFDSIAQVRDSALAVELKKAIEDAAERIELPSQLVIDLPDTIIVPVSESSE